MLKARCGCSGTFSFLSVLAPTIERDTRAQKHAQDGNRMQVAINGGPRAKSRRTGDKQEQDLGQKQNCKPACHHLPKNCAIPSVNMQAFLPILLKKWLNCQSYHENKMMVFSAEKLSGFIGWGIDLLSTPTDQLQSHFNTNIFKSTQYASYLVLPQF